jgi:hypothetical protein
VNLTNKIKTNRERLHFEKLTESEHEQFSKEVEMMLLIRGILPEINGQTESFRKTRQILDKVQDGQIRLINGFRRYRQVRPKEAVPKAH